MNHFIFAHFTVFLLQLPQAKWRVYTPDTSYSVQTVGLLEANLWLVILGCINKTDLTRQLIAEKILLLPRGCVLMVLRSPNLSCSTTIRTKFTFSASATFQQNHQYVVCSVQQFFIVCVMNIKVLGGCNVLLKYQQISICIKSLAPHSLQFWWEY